MDPAFKAVVDAKIPLIIYKAGGIAAADHLGAMNFIGSDPYKASCNPARRARCRSAA